MTDFSSLIERIEAATEGSRELDAEVYEAVVGLRMYESIHERSGDLCLRYYPGSPGPEYGRLPHYTTSIDASRSIVPGFLCVFASDIGADGQPMVKVVTDTGTNPIIEYTGIAATLELAWLAAILRARQAADTESQS